LKQDKLLKKTKTYPLDGDMEDEAKLGRTLFKQRNYREAEQHLRNAARLQERALGIYHVDTLTSKYYLGAALQKQGKVSETETLLREVLVGWERTCGRDHKKTLRTQFRLGLALHDKQKYTEAAQLRWEVLIAQERVCGRDHAETLNTKHYLGVTLSKPGKKPEAEKVLRETVEGLESTCGRDHKFTLATKYDLGSVLHDLKKYGSAESLFRQLIEDNEQVHGREHSDTLDTKHMLGQVLKAQRKHSEAEEVLRQVATGRERTLGYEHGATLSSKHWLGAVLENQSNFIEAEEVLRQVVSSQERTLGHDHEDTLASKYGLRNLLRHQQKYGEAKEVLQQVLHGNERTHGPEHTSTIKAREVLERVLLKLRTPASRLSSFFSEGQERQTPFTDPEITEVSALLKHSNPRWSKSPRTYIVLRITGYLNLIDELIDAGFSDYWFPVTERSLPSCLLPSVKTTFAKAQKLVLTKSLDLEKGEKGQHCHYNPGESAPFESKEVLGRGAFGQVDKVLSLISFKEYARKQVLRSLVFKRRKAEDINMFIGEIEILKRIKHHHIVELIGSYTYPRYMSLIMSPVAQMDLNKYLADTTSSNYPELRTFFGCLATALEYLHGEKIRHKDIKPANILIDRGRVLFTDFGLSRDFSDAEGSTTMSMVNGMTPKYCSPEVAQHEPRNTMSDIWSLGVVFMEMIAILKGMTIQTLYDFFKQPGVQQGFIRTKLEALPEVIAAMGGMGNPLDNRGTLVNY
jgi:tetratricopeptide (TPR) repeat protein